MTAKTKKGTATADLLIDELRHLRMVAREAAQTFILRQEGDIETIITCLSTISAGTARRKSPEWRSLLATLRLKSEKGRLKDLKALHETVRQLLASVLDETEARPQRRKSPGKKEKPKAAAPPPPEATL